MTNKCKGTITRRRKTIYGIEESIIDFLILSEGLYEHLMEMKIDDALTLSWYIKRKDKVHIIPSDHIPIVAQFNIKWRKNRKP